MNTLEKKTNKNFLVGIIPDDWEQITYEKNGYWMIKCKRNDLVTSENYFKREKEFNLICDKLKNEFGENIMEIYEITSCGINFIIYLKK